MNNVGRLAAPPQQITLPDTLNIELNLTIVDVQVVLEGLGEIPQKRSGAAVMKINMQTQAAVNNYVQSLTPPPMSAPKATDPVAFTASYAVGSAMLAQAESVRREPNGSLDVTPTPDMPPEFDYGSVLGLVTTGLQHLDEALPNGQHDRVVAAYLACRHGMELFRQWLDPRL